MAFNSYPFYTNPLPSERFTMITLSDMLGKSRYDFAVPHAPFLAPNKVLGIDEELPLSILEFPQFCSIKYNGIRGLTLNNEFMSRSMKPLNICSTVRDEIMEIAEWAHSQRIVLDGEFHSYSYNTVGETTSILAGTIPLPSDFYFKCFYCLPYDQWNGFTNDTAWFYAFHEKNSLEVKFSRFQLVRQKTLNSFDEMLAEIDRIRFSNKEGLMFLDPFSYYKIDRATIKEATLLKFKFYSDPIDAKVFGITSRKERKEDVLTKYNEGTRKAEQVHTQDSFIETEVAGVLICKVEGKGEVISVPFPVGTSLGQRELYFTHFGSGSEFDLKGQWLNFRRLSVEDRNKPISIKDVQFRDSKD